MSFKLTHALPEKCLVAVSGGIDSSAALHWLNKKEGRVQGVVHMYHNTGAWSKVAEVHTRQVCKRLDIPFHVRRLRREPTQGESKENWWREQRYRWFKEVSAVNDNLPVVVAHNMNDCLEEYLMCTMVRGFSGTIPYAHDPCIRPFRMWKREEIHEYAKREDLWWVDDPTNEDTHKYKRAFIRQNVVPGILELNPGVWKIPERVIKLQDERDERAPQGFMVPRDRF